MRIPVVSIIFLFIFPLLLDFYISVDVKSLWKKRGFIIYCISAALCYALLIVALSLPRRDANANLIPVMWLLFTFITIYVMKAFYMIGSLLGRFWQWIFRIENKNYFFNWLGLGLGVVLCALMWIGAVYTRRHIMVTHADFYSEKLPAAFDGYKIVQLSDLHVGSWGYDTSFIKTLVDSVNGLHPDMIVVTGDLVNRQSTELKPFMKELSRLKAKDGVYSILGNHDYGDYIDWPNPEDKVKNLEQLKDYQAQMGWEMLNNDSRYIKNGGDSILLIGVENWGENPFPQYGDLKKAVINKPKGTVLLADSTYKILLSHNPEHWRQEVSQTTNIDLTLAGHTHAMQGMVKLGNFKWSPSKYRYEEWGGDFHRKNERGENTTLYVNIGAGSVGMPARLLSAYPEITLITLRPDSIRK